ncbi:MAG: hypothetical protein LAO20_22495 [Acidobacteriia bacterium]|nr:hypothetical protein [Terriglobia bacterium]
MTQSDDHEPSHTSSNHQQRLKTCRPNELRPHPAYVRHHLSVSATKLSKVAEQGERALREPLFITQDHLILDGYARWELARQQGDGALPCVQFELSEAEALLWLLHKHRRADGLNAFSRILLALDLEPWLKEKARSNQQAGGQNKGSSKLTEAERLDVRSEIALAAGVSVGNLSKAKRLRSSAISELLDALRSGEISIHRAWTWSQAAPADQREALWCYRNERGVNKEIRALISKHRAKSSPKSFNLIDLLRALPGLEAEELASVSVKLLRAHGKTIFITEELLRILASQGGVLALQ